MNELMNQFKAIAPAIVDAVRARVTASSTEADVMNIIHEEIIAFFDKQQRMAVEYLTFDADRRATFGIIMFELLKPLADKMPKSMNPNYQAYVEKTGNEGALNFITNRH